MVIVLVGAYRSLGGGPARSEDSRALLTAAAASLRGALDTLPSTADVTGAEQPAAGDARDGRRASAAAQQVLDRLPTPSQLNDSEASARALLQAAAEDAGWAWRMVGAGITSPGVSAAVIALADHAADCCDEADALLSGLAGAAAGGEPADSS